MHGSGSTSGKITLVRSYNCEWSRLCFLAVFNLHRPSRFFNFFSSRSPPYVCPFLHSFLISRVPVYVRLSVCPSVRLSVSPIILYICLHLCLSLSPLPFPLSLTISLFLRPECNTGPHACEPAAGVLLRRRRRKRCHSCAIPHRVRNRVARVVCRIRCGSVVLVLSAGLANDLFSLFFSTALACCRPASFDYKRLIDNFNRIFGQGLSPAQQ